MTGRGSNRLTYDAENRLIYVTSSTGTSTMIYDGDGGRVEKITPAGTTIYIGKLYECTGTNCIKYIFSGGSRIATKTVTGNSIYYYHTDHLGSSSVMTDASGKNAETMKYAPYGATYYDSYLSGTGAIYTPYKYTGQYFDSDISLYFYNARYYDPVLGRFISADTLIGRATDPQSLNRYSYVRNNPILYADPSGHCWCINQIVQGFNDAGNGISDSANRMSTWMSDDRVAVVQIATFVGDAVAIGTGNPELVPFITGAGFGSEAAVQHKPLEDILIATLIGGVTGYLGGAASDAMYSSVLEQNVAGDYFGAGMAGGFIYSAGNSAANGRSFFKSLEVAMISSEIGGFASVATNAAANYYQSWLTYDAPLLPGTGEGKYETINGYSPCQKCNTFGSNEDITPGFWNHVFTLKQGGYIVSDIGNYATFGGHALSALHDSWVNYYNFEFLSLGNWGTMLPAAVISYGAILNNGPLLDQLIISREK